MRPGIAAAILKRLYSFEIEKETSRFLRLNYAPILKRLYRILIKMFVLCIAIALCITGEFTVCLRSEDCSQSIEICRELPARDILQALRDETMNDPRERIEMAQSHAFYRPPLLGKP